MLVRAGMCAGAGARVRRHRFSRREGGVNVGNDEATRGDVNSLRKPLNDAIMSLRVESVE